MRPQLLLTPLKWLLTLGLLGGLLFGLFRIHQLMRAERDGDDLGKKETPEKISNKIVKLEEDEAERYGVKTEPARALQWYEMTTVYGRVIPNPRATSEIRAPFAGTLRGAAYSAWPTPAQWVRAGQTLGWLDIRISPDVRLDLQNKLAEARVKQSGAEEEVKVQQDRVNSLKAATAQEILARSELDAALVQLTQARTQFAAAKAAAEQWNKAIQEVERHKDGDNSLWSHSLTAPSDGEVTDLSGRPGMAVEAGALIAQLVDFRHPLIRLDFPPELAAQGYPPSNVEVHVPSLRTRKSSHRASLVGLAPRIEAASQFVSYLYEADLAAPVRRKENGSGYLWRPGMQALAQVRSESAAAESAVAVPAGSILYHQGLPWVFVRMGDETYERRAVRLLGRQGDRAIIAQRQGSLAIGVAPKESVVASQAQILLAREFLVGSLDDD